MIDYVTLVAGLVLLLIGGDWLVRGSVGLAEKLQVPPLIIGLTIVSFGTSAPELFVSLNSALTGADGIAIGNIVGSNISNVLMVLGVPALFWVLNCDEKGIGRSILVMIGVSILFIGMMQKGTLSRLDGLTLVAILALFLYDQFRNARKARKTTEDQFDYHDEVENIPGSNRAILFALILGFVLLPTGSELTVNAAVEIAKGWGISLATIGLTVVAIGTSLPELATTLMALRRGNSSVALGNIVGSNILNITLIIGLTSLTTPLTISQHVFAFDVWVMLTTTIILGGFAYRNLTIRRPMGIVMTLSYIIYLFATVVYFS